MKKLFALITLLTICLTVFAACTPEDNTQLRVGYMAGPTGMGMAKLIHDNAQNEAENVKYSFSKYSKTENAFKDFSAGNIDLICVPTNEAAKYYNAANNDTVVLSINCLGTLYLISDNTVEFTSFDQLEGKTIYTCSDGNPKMVLDYLLEATGINATVLTSINNKEIVSPQDILAAAKSGLIDIAVAPEPIVTSITLQNSSFSVDLNLSNVWNECVDTQLTMGCIIAKRSFVNEHKSLINSFLSEYKASIEFINAAKNVESAAQYIVDAEIMGAVPAAKKSLNNLRGAIAYLDGNEMKAALVGFYNAIGTDNIGGTLPNDEFYYKK